ncbi:methylmalonyl-CoA mutase family protein [Nocardiopsis ansamitocini]|uniref:methylmalonyl-CoA mutase n=1 Tax=Nocardiopsis ansamitocini TaxID=1670832 RepID=A0A9W6P8W8_9ACTN|nr:methylmalonyl-CoA mutase family protein [Nocardiopsis ansamitocini]GLU49133.1 methylmalonyl-CoA mutase [Nocardiopsis ansamitocini]
MSVPENAATAPEALALAAEFPSADPGQWRELVAGVLRKSGADPDSARSPEDLLNSTTYDRITIRPLYTGDDGLDSGFPGLAPFTRGSRPQGAVPNGWDVRQRHADPDPAATRKAVMADLENGVTSLWLATGAAGVATEHIGEVLADVYLDLAPVTLDAGTDYEAAARALLQAHSDRRVPDSAVVGCLGIDPLGTAARTGGRAEVAEAAGLAAPYAARYPALRLMVADGTPVHDAGGSEAQELGAAVAAGVAYLRALTDAGLSTADAASRIEFRFAATADQFLTIAKLRAARAMWNRVTEVCGLAPHHRGMRQHAVTSAAMMTRRDPYVNMLRTTLACFGAGAGGADAITVLPFDTAVGLPDGLSRRIARNTQALLVEESHVARVIDPAGGSFYVERLTADLYEHGWAFLRELEGAGGAATALADGVVAERVREVWERRRANLAHRRDPLTGVSEFPNLAEKPLVRPAAPSAPAAPGALPVHRYAEDYEALRDRSDAVLAATGARPHVFLATLGPVAAHTARATFAANLFQAGGIATTPGGGAEGPEAVAAAFTASGARIACLCSSDKVYAEHAADAAAALKAAGAEQVLLAGKRSAELERAGVDGFVFAGCDALTLLTRLNDTLGAAR